MFKISYKFTEEEGLRAFMSKYRATQHKRVVFFSFLFSVAIIIYLSYDFFSGESKEMIALLPIITMVAFTIYFVFGIEKKIATKYKRRFKQRKDINKDFYIEMLDDRIVAIIENLGKSELRWDGIAKSVIIKEGIFLYISASSYYWLPSTGFESDTIFRDACDFVKSKIKNVKDIS